jgi:hypothetical protein
VLVQTTVRLLRGGLVASALPGLNTTVLVQVTQVLRPLRALPRRAALILHRLAMRVKQAIHPTTHLPGGSLWTHHTTHLHRRVLRRKRITLMSLLETPGQATPAKTLVAQPALPMCLRLPAGHHNSVSRHARRVLVPPGSHLSSTAQAMTLRLKTTPSRPLLTLHRRTPNPQRQISPLIPLHAPLLVLRRHPIRLADSLRMAYHTRLLARPARVATLVQTQQAMLAKRTNQQCMPTISLLFLPTSRTKCPLLFTRLGETTNTTKAPNLFLDGLCRPLFLLSNGAIRLLNAPG